jgi:hypothetical protein
LWDSIGIPQFILDADADDETRFSLHDAVAIPGLWPVSRVPLHQFRTAQWGMASKDLEIGGTEDGTAVIKNDDTDLRTEVEKLWSALDALANVVKALAPITTSPGNPTTPNPSQVTTINNLTAAWLLDKLGLRRILA